LAKHILHTGDDELDFVLLGIVCPENQYRVCSLVNDALGISLFLSDYVPLSLKDGKMFRFSLFRFPDEALGLEYFFVPNASNFDDSGKTERDSGDLFSGVEIDERVLLVKELPKTNYFLIVKGQDLHNYQFKIMDALKTITAIMQVQLIEPNELPSRKNLIF
jgi:hypothetical protein